MSKSTVSEGCPRGDIAAYVDGELSVEAENALERHLDNCVDCRRTLMEQRRFLAALSAALGGFSLEIPTGFAATIASRARRSVSLKQKFLVLIGRGAW